MKIDVKKDIILVLMMLVLAILFIPKKTTKKDMETSVLTGVNINDTKNSIIPSTPPTQDQYFEKRKFMVDTQLKARDIKDKKVLDAMLKVPRHQFLTKNLDKAYDDYPLPIGFGQTISQPYIVALMTQSLDIKPTDTILEIGTGSGYQAAILSELAKEVYTIEIIGELAKESEKRLKELGYAQVKIKNADGYFGWQDAAPFDKIIITAAVNHIPPPLTKQLADGGKLIIPLGSTLRFQTLTLVTKKGKELDTEYITGVRFVPLTGYAQEK